MSARPATIFFAIPCGDFYTVQEDIIRNVCEASGVSPDIVEDDPSTKGLWEKVTQQIDKADFFVADVTSRSPNIVVELGYAIARKPINRMAVFIANHVEVPSDLGGLIVQKYSSLASFQQRLIDWIATSVPLVNTEKMRTLRPERIEFSEDFQDQDLFLKRWWTPPRCSYLLTAEGLRFSWAHFPILSNTLAILGDCEFEFDARINARNVGWVVKGTSPPESPWPIFLIMFNLSNEGRLGPHIWTIEDPVTNTQYHPYETCNVDIKTSERGWFTLVTRVRGDVIEIFNDGRRIFGADFSSPPYADAYNTISEKMGQVGFRCHPGEVATVKRVRVKELTDE